jgi:hypothetical protein
MNTVTQTSLFDAVPDEKPIQPLSEDPTRAQLMEALECLHHAIESVSDLPDEIYDTHMGVATRTTRENYICKGYSYRHMANELNLARMIFDLNFTAIFPHHGWANAMQKKLDRAILKQSTDIMHAYYEHHPAIEEKPRWSSF